MSFRKFSFFTLFLVISLKFQHERRRALTKCNEWFHATMYSRLRVTAILNCMQPGKIIFRQSYHLTASTILLVLVERLKKDAVITPLRHIHMSTEHRDQKTYIKSAKIKWNKNYRINQKRLHKIAKVSCKCLTYDHWQVT
jgi:predicted Zn-ribbon and HTH transcriptional regulator